MYKDTIFVLTYSNCILQITTQNIVVRCQTCSDSVHECVSIAVVRCQVCTDSVHECVLNTHTFNSVRHLHCKKIKTILLVSTVAIGVSI